MPSTPPASFAPLPTRYAGCHFRSRLEARWAVFFDALGIKWEYEPEGFKLSNGDCYLPDFWLPEFQGPITCRPCDETPAIFQKKTGPGIHVFNPGPGLFVEVKAPGGDFRKPVQLAQDTGRFVLLLDGAPRELGNFACVHPLDGKTYPIELRASRRMAQFKAAVQAARSERFGT